MRYFLKSIAVCSICVSYFADQKYLVSKPNTDVKGCLAALGKLDVEIKKQLLYTAKAHLPWTREFGMTLFAQLKLPWDVVRVISSGLKNEVSPREVKIQLLDKLKNNRHAYVTAMLAFLFYRSQRISQDDFDEKTKEFEDEIENKVYIFVNAHTVGTTEYLTEKYRFDIKYKHLKNFFYIEASRLDELNEKLAGIKRDHGPIYGMGIASHGLPGLLELGTNSIRSSNLYNSKFSYENLFEPNGKIRLSACLIGNGNRGKDFVRNVGNIYLLGGGKVYAAQAKVPGKDNARRLQQYLGLNNSSANLINEISNTVFSTNLLNRDTDYFYMLLMKYGIEGFESFPKEKVDIEVIRPYAEKKHHGKA